MPVFESRPPANASQSGYRLIRTPAGHALRAVVISDNLVGCRTHFVGNRTIPCEAPECEPCQSGVAWRWHAYLLVLVESTQEIVIFETTAIASKSFAAYHDRNGTTRGCLFEAERIKGRANGRVLIRCRPADLQRLTLPPDQPVELLLCHIWNVAPNQAVVPPEMSRPPAREVRIDRTRPELQPAGDVDGPTRMVFQIPQRPKRNGERR